VEMMNLKNDLEVILSYYELLSEVNGSDLLKDEFKEQRNNIGDIDGILKRFKDNKSIFLNAERLDTQVTQDKLMIINKYLTDLSWHISELQDLNVELIKLRIKSKK
jgi:hypothetical protein